MSDFNEEHDFVWTIENYSLFNFKTQTLPSPTFLTELLNGNEWRLVFILKGSDSQGFLELVLGLHSSQPIDKVNASFKIEFCNADEEVFLSLEKDEVEFKKFSRHRFEYLISGLIRTEEVEKKIKDSSKDILIIRCSSMPNSATIINPSKRILSAETEICCNMFSFYWDVEYSVNPDWSATKTFTIKDEDEIQVCITIKYHQEDVLFDIKEVKKVNFISCLTRRVKCEIILHVDEDDLLSKWEVFNFGRECDTRQFPSFFKKSMIEDSEYCCEGMLLKFNFSFQNYIRLSKSTYETESDSPTVPKNISAIDNLSGDMRAMLLKGEHTDVTFRIGCETASAHKLVLASRSPVFSAMFQQDVIENETGVIEITDMDLQTLRLFLEFLYTGEIEVSDCDSALDLVLVADKYQVSSLKDRCSEFLKDSLTTDNVCDVVSVADMMGHQHLKKVAVDYIKENAEEVLHSQNWSVLIGKNTKLCSEIISTCSKNFNPYSKRDR